MGWREFFASVIGSLAWPIVVLFAVGSPDKPESFPYQWNKQSWVIWVWKGDYPAMGDGGEIAAYVQNVTLAHAGGQWLANSGLAGLPSTSESVSIGGSTIASSGSARSWVWNGTWDPFKTDADVNDLKFTATVTFPSSGEFNAFMNSEFVAGNSAWSPGPSADTATFHD
jgi:hypothetical protein